MRVAAKNRSNTKPTRDVINLTNYLFKLSAGSLLIPALPSWSGSAYYHYHHNHHYWCFYNKYNNIMEDRISVRNIFLLFPKCSLFFVWSLTILLMLNNSASFICLSKSTRMVLFRRIIWYHLTDRYEDDIF